VTHGVPFHLVPSWLYSIFTQETEHCFIFFNTVILIWTLATIPVFGAIGSSYDVLFSCYFGNRNWKKVEGRYGKLIACGLCTMASLIVSYIFSLCFVYYIAPPLEHVSAVYSLFGTEFLVACYLVFGYPLCIFINTLAEVVSYSLPASAGHTSSLMGRSQARSAIEDLAKQTRFPLGNIYLQNVNNNQVELQAQHVKVAGPPWRRSILVTNTAIEKCSTQELTAIVAHHMADWRHGLIYKITMSVLVSQIPRSNILARTKRSAEIFVICPGRVICFQLDRYLSIIWIYQTRSMSQPSFIPMMSCTEKILGDPR
jgi:Zn-dependent protease with chaperone function